MSRASSSGKLTPGRILYLLYHRPVATVRQSAREGGPLNQWIDARGRHAMRRAAATLPPRPRPPVGAPEVSFLTGKKFWFQTAFCAWSLAQSSGREFSPVFLDDGTFDEALFQESIRIFPGATILDRTEIERRLDTHLPASRFPTLRAQRRTYIHLRKLTDAHVGHRGWRLVLDSDMLFFRRPDALLSWIDTPTRPIHMVDVQDAYGYPTATLAELADRPIPSFVNVGICGLRSEAIDWEKIEWWCAQLLARHGTSYYLEQALVALLLAKAAPLRLPPSDYLLLPSVAECRAPTAALHHYVDLSKRGYLRHAWRHIIRS
jgi:hypothetical protein